MRNGKYYVVERTSPVTGRLEYLKLSDDYNLAGWSEGVRDAYWFDYRAPALNHVKAYGGKVITVNFALTRE